MLNILDQIKVKFRHLILPQKALAQLAAPHQSILDVGCGLGTFLMALSGQGKKLKGVEVSHLTVQKAQSILRRKGIEDVEITYFNGNPATILNLEKYDAIFLNDVLHHIPPQDQINFLKKTYDNLRQGAQLILKDIDAASFWVIFNKFHDLILNRQYPHERSIQEYCQICKTLGFRIDQRISAPKLVYPHFILVMTKM